MSRPRRIHAGGGSVEAWSWRRATPACPPKSRRSAFPRLGSLSWNWSACRAPWGALGKSRSQFIPPFVRGRRKGWLAGGMGTNRTRTQGGRGGVVSMGRTSPLRPKFAPFSPKDGLLPGTHEGTDGGELHHSICPRASEPAGYLNPPRDLLGRPVRPGGAESGMIGADRGGVSTPLGVVASCNGTANWIPLGETNGPGRMHRYRQAGSSVRKAFSVSFLCPDVRQLLRQAQRPPFSEAEP